MVITAVYYYIGSFRQKLSIFSRFPLFFVDFPEFPGRFLFINPY